MVQSKLLAARACDARKNWDEDEDFNGFLRFGNQPRTGAS
jgi:hypothetical protein